MSTVAEPAKTRFRVGVVCCLFCRLGCLDVFVVSGAHQTDAVAALGAAGMVDIRKLASWIGTLSVLLFPV